MKPKHITQIEKLSDKYNLHEVLEYFTFAGVNEKKRAIAKILNISQCEVYSENFTELVKTELDNIVA